MPKFSAVTETELTELEDLLRANEPGRALLSTDAIRYHRGRGDIVIEPFRPRDLKTTSYDVRIGHYLYREQHESGNAYFSPFSEKQVRRHWGEPQQAESARAFMRQHGPIEGVRGRNHVIVLAPGETILGHTLEVIGGRNCVSTEMRARSSMGRIGITVCKCAGWGDLGYVNRWTMELTNHLRDTHLVLVEGMRVAQLIFMKVDPIKSQQTYAGTGGKYQTTDDMKTLVRSWHPEGMLPKLYRDYETVEGFPNDPIRVNLKKRR